MASEPDKEDYDGDVEALQQLFSEKTGATSSSGAEPPGSHSATATGVAENVSLDQPDSTDLSCLWVSKMGMI